MEKLSYRMCVCVCPSPCPGEGQRAGRVPKGRKPPFPPPELCKCLTASLWSPLTAPQKPHSPPCLCLHGGRSSPRSLSAVVAHNSPGTERVFKPLFPLEEQLELRVHMEECVLGGSGGRAHVRWMKPFPPRFTFTHNGPLVGDRKRKEH